MGGRTGIKANSRWLGIALCFAVLWLILAEGELAYAPGVAVGSVLVALASAIFLAPCGRRKRPRGVARPIAASVARVRGLLGLLARIVGFFAYFAWISTVGGLDVARRAFRRRPPLAPELIAFFLALEKDTPAAAFFAGIMSLVPGTLCADIEGEQLTIHVIDRDQANLERLRDLERRVAHLFSVPLLEERR